LVQVGLPDVYSAINFDTVLFPLSQGVLLPVMSNYCDVADLNLGNGDTSMSVVIFFISPPLREEQL